MDRQTIYPGQVPLETDLLKTNQNVMIGLAKLSQAIFGTGGMATGFATTQSTIPALTVSVAPGEVYIQTTLETTAISSLPQDIAHAVVKQGILLDAVTLAITPPGTAGFSINYLMQVGYQDTDSGSAVLPYYNASNPSVAYSGPANSGTAQPTIRQGTAVVSAKAGTAATSGTQTTPSPDAGKIGLYVVTVANGASTILNAAISSYLSAPVLATPVSQGRLIARRVFTSTQAYTPTPGTNCVDVTIVAGGGGGGGAAATSAGQCAAGAGGGGGGWARKRIAAAFAGATITIGSGGAGGVLAVGGNGSSSSFGALVSATGGTGGSLGAAASNATVVVTGSGTPGVGSSGDANYQGGFGRYAVYLPTPTSGEGGSSFCGSGGSGATGFASGGNAPNNSGGGGGGGSCTASVGGATGGAGAAGLCIVEEYS